MSRDPHIAVKFRALAQAMNAQNGEVDRAELRLLEQDVFELLPEKSRLGAAVKTFIESCELWSRDPVKLAEVGRDMAHYIEVHNMPEPSGYQEDAFNG